MKTLEEVKKHFSNAKIVKELHTDVVFFLDFESIHQDNDMLSIWCNDSNGRIRWLMDQFGQLSEILEKVEPHVKFTNTELKQVQKPKHYDTGSIDVIDFCKVYDLNFNLGNVIKYVARCGKKDDAIRDLQKAIDYLNREIKYLKSK